MKSPDIPGRFTEPGQGWFSDRRMVRSWFAAAMDVDVVGYAGWWRFTVIGL
jgi:hypothetical protein